MNQYRTRLEKNDREKEVWRFEFTKRLNDILTFVIPDVKQATPIWKNKEGDLWGESCDVVIVEYDNGYIKEVNTHMDSATAIVRDVIGHAQ